MLILKSIQADLERERTGDWVESRQWPGVRFRVCALTKPAYEIKRDELAQRLARQSKGKPQSKEKMAPHLAKLYCSEILSGWDGIDIPYSPETALEVLSDPAYRELVAEIEYCAGTLSNVEADYLEAELGKSESPSAPSSKNAVKNPTSSAT